MSAPSELQTVRIFTRDGELSLVSGELEIGKPSGSIHVVGRFATAEPVPVDVYAPLLFAGLVAERGGYQSYVVGRASAFKLQTLKRSRLPNGRFAQKGVATYCLHSSGGFLSIDPEYAHLEALFDWQRSIFTDPTTTPIFADWCDFATHSPRATHSGGAQRNRPPVPGSHRNRSKAARSADRYSSSE
jgi:hypothetical protein